MSDQRDQRDSNNGHSDVPHPRLVPERQLSRPRRRDRPILRGNCSGSHHNGHANGDHRGPPSTRKSEGCGEEGPLRFIFFAEFHPVQGPIVRCQVPKDGETIPKDVFDSLSVYIIPKQQLAFRTIATNTRGYKILGYPVILEDKRYKRNQFIFNICFVCHPWSRTAQYESALIKLTNFFANLERESQYLSSEENNVELARVLEAVFHDLNDYGQAKATVQENSLELHVVPLKEDPPIVKDHDVPIIVQAIPENLEFDLTSKQVLPFINGISHVAKISAMANVSTSLVKSCVKNLAFHGLVKIVPIFQFSNSYSVNSTIMTLVSDHDLQTSFMEAVNDGNSDEEKANFGEALGFVTSLKHGVAVRDVCQRLDVGRKLMLNVPKMIQFLCVHKLLRRIHKYPYYDEGIERAYVEKSTSFPLDELPSAVPENFHRGHLISLFDGSRTFDEICIITGLSDSTLQEFIDFEMAVLVIEK